MSTFRRTTNPKEFPIEVVMLFEKASYGPVRFPIEGKGYPSEALAFGAKMALARWRAQMLRSEHPAGFGTMLRGIQFKAPTKGPDGWFFNIEPLSTNPTIELAKEVVGAVDADATETFWSQFHD